jgi:SAM-dependent methyltransferase
VKQESFRKLYKLVNGYQVTQAIFTILKLRIPDLLSNGKFINELADSIGVNENKLYRIMLALASEGIFKETKKYFFEHTVISKHLTSNEMMSQLIIHRTLRDGETNYHSWSKLYESLKKNKCAFDIFYEMSFYDYIKKNKHFGNSFNKSMLNITKYSLPSILNAYDFSKYKTIVDVGGGYGQLMDGVLEKNPYVRAIVYDLPEVVDLALAERKNKKNGIEFIKGNFFEQIPDDADLLILRNILHNWSDEKAVLILNNCRKAMKSNSKLLIIENKALKDEKDFNIHAWKDLEMLVYFDGKERDLNGISELIDNSNLFLNKIFQTKGLSILIEVK